MFVLPVRARYETFKGNYVICTFVIGTVLLHETTSQVRTNDDLFFSLGEISNSEAILY